MKTEEMIAVMQAHLRGEKIEVLVPRPPDGTDEWIPVVAPIWNWSFHKYRVAPKPEPKMPDGIFWVRFKSSRQKEALLVTRVGEVDVSFGTNGIATLGDFYRNMDWSHDRKTWFTFTGEEVKS